MAQGLLRENGAAAVTIGGAAAAWVVLLAGYALGLGNLLAHGTVLESDSRALPVAVLLFIAGWQVMIGAMMLPSTVPVVEEFTRTRNGRSRGGLAVFLAAYFAVWTVFGVAALSGDAAVHHLAHNWHWLEERPSLVAAAVLVLAGAYQFLPVKRRCLAECRSPAGLLDTDGRPDAGAWRPGVRHAIACLGSSWALMLVMFAVGVHTLWVVAALTVVLLAEKTFPIGPGIVPVVGAALIAGGVFAAW
ncbi:DUF2182 domain-containing protein [Allosalinactinospora lopnorensis]|uniref:DUF2182 domain-containing protein n=1 Tax=Allosalinactinospora lopnorensis TaxID=1352348 RepID=UPI000623D814|nr:DUF2182 domain-containing protein [Allosalinactinospora lopnorensis]